MTGYEYYEKTLYDCQRVARCLCSHELGQKASLVQSHPPQREKSPLRRNGQVRYNPAVRIFLIVLVGLVGYGWPSVAWAPCDDLSAVQADSYRALVHALSVDMTPCVNEATCGLLDVWIGTG